MFLPHLKNRVQESAVVVSVPEPAPRPIVATDPPRKDFSEPVPGLFQTPDGFQRIRFNPATHGADYYGACECCKVNRGGEYWNVVTFTSVTNCNGGTYWPQSRHSLFCFRCAGNRQEGLHAYVEPAAEPDDSPPVNFSEVKPEPAPVNTQQEDYRRETIKRVRGQLLLQAEQCEGKRISNYSGNLYEFILPDGTRRHCNVKRSEGMKEARAALFELLWSESDWSPKNQADPAAEPAPEPLPNFGDSVQTPDGRTGTMRGSGGMGSDRVQVENAAGNRSWHNRSELRRVATAPAPAPTVETASTCPPSVDFSDDNDTFEDFEAKESAVIAFGKELEATRIATIQDWTYRIEPQQDRPGFQIVITGPDGFSQIICSGIYGFAFDTFDRTVSYAVQKARSRFVCHPETFQNGCQIEKRYHKRRGVFVYVVTLPEPVKGSKFDTLETRAKRFNGWYAREYRPEYQRGGFMFPKKRDAERFANDFTPSAKVATMRHTDTKPEPAPETPSGDFSDRQPKEPRTFGDILKQLTEEPNNNGDTYNVASRVFAIHGKPGEYHLTIVDDRGGVEKLPGFVRKEQALNAIAETARIALDLPGFLTPEDERRDAETRVDALGRQSRWTVRGFCGTDGPPSVFDRKRDAIDYAVANRRAILCRWCGHVGWYPENWPTTGTPSGDFSETETTPEPAPAIDRGKSWEIQNAEKLEALADGMQKTIDEKTRPMTQNWTRKRGEEYAHRMHEGENREREYARPYEGLEKYHDRTPLAIAFRAFIAQRTTPEDSDAVAKRERRKAIEKAEERLRACDVAGFFPTPKQAAVRVLNAAQIPENPPEDFSILEPSCGIGSLLELVADLHPELVPRIDCIETWSAAADVTELKGFGPVHRTDFLEVDAFDWGRKYDRIVMNPPFEDLQGIDHVKHAFNFLKPGGRLVAILPDGYFQTAASRRKVQDFQLFVDDLNGETFPLANAFTGADAFRQTGVSCRVLILDAPE